MWGLVQGCRFFGVIKHAYEQKRDLGHITLKIVVHDEQKRDSGQITLKIVTGGGQRRARMKARMKVVLKVRVGIAMAEGIWFFAKPCEK